MSDVAETAAELQNALTKIDGSLVEDKRYSISVHYRLVATEQIAAIETAVDQAIVRHPRLKKRLGKKVFELRPALPWDKGKAVIWLMETIDETGTGTLPIYVGDDETDEDAFRALADVGVGVLVSDEPRRTAASYRLRDTEETRRFLARLAAGGGSMRSWHLVQKGYLPEEEGYREALFTLGNGYFATRGAAPECIADGIHYPGTYLAGGYNRLQTEMAGRIIENEDLVNLPNWLPLQVRVLDGPWFHVDRAHLRDYCQRLDTQHGIFERDLTFIDDQDDFIDLCFQGARVFNL